MSGNDVRALLVEDHFLTRQELSVMLLNSPLIDELEAVGSVREAMCVKATGLDLLLLDISLPDGSGLDLIPHFRGQSSELKVLVLTVHQDETNTLQAIESGADGYTLKDDPQLLDHVAQVLSGRHPIDSRVTRHLLTEHRRPGDGAVSLTPREQQTLAGLARGLRYDELATHMQVSVNTVPDYIKSLYRKLDVHSRSEAVFEASRLGLIRLSPDR